MPVITPPARTRHLHPAISSTRRPSLPDRHRLQNASRSQHHVGSLTASMAA